LSSLVPPSFELWQFNFLVAERGGGGVLLTLDINGRQVGCVLKRHKKTTKIAVRKKVCSGFKKFNKNVCPKCSVECFVED
jgi:hypothetical protein